MALAGSGKAAPPANIAPASVASRADLRMTSSVITGIVCTRFDPTSTRADSAPWISAESQARQAYTRCRGKRKRRGGQLLLAHRGVRQGVATLRGLFGYHHQRRKPQPE